MLWQTIEHEQLTSASWDEHRANLAVATIVAEAEASILELAWPTHPRDAETSNAPAASLYLGSAGMVWALHKLDASLELEPVIAGVLARYRSTPDFDAMAWPASLWMGETGIPVVALALGAGEAERRRLSALVTENREHPTWELMWGSPGTALAARAAGLEDAWRDSAEVLWERWDERSDLWTQNLYGQRSQILGPAHGFAGNVHALRGFNDDDVLRARVSRALEDTAVREDSLVNWPPSAAPPEGFDFPIRAQWCHGAAGIIATLGDLMPRDLALAGGELTWRAGPPRKGPGLCHGTAGSGFAFLKLYELTEDTLWLARAQHFAKHAIEQVERERDLVGRGRFTLWTGDVGTALYIRACSEARAGVPTFDYW